MNLPFSTHWPDRMPEHMAGKPTYFPEKIWKSLMHDVGVPDKEYYKWHGEEGILNYNMGSNYDDSVLVEPKIHTIRPISKQWKPGVMIDFFIWTGKPYRSPHFKFAPRVPLISKQFIDIYVKSYGINSATGFQHPKKIEAIIDGEKIYDSSWIIIDDMKKLAQNDGFDKVNDFFAWFNEDFSGVLINWTDFKY